MPFPLLLRAAAIVGVAVLILIPIRLIDGKIHERQARAQGVEQQFASETSGPQTIVGPLLALSCEETYTEERQVMRGGKAETVSERKVTACPTGYFAPRTFKATGSLPVETLHRGIYPIRLYRAALEMSGEIEWPAAPAPNGLNARAWKQATLSLVVSDPRGIKTLTGGTLNQDLGDYASRTPGEILPFAYRTQLVGTSSLAIAPVGDTSEIRLTSDWPHPSFFGSWSPDERSITRDGFVSVWRTTRHATGGAGTWAKQGREGTLAASTAVAGVSMYDPVNAYALAYRATEYGFLFVLFTFTALALTEAIAGVKLHAIQYLLVGSALAIFFLLLVALSEHLAFAHAYAAAATACVALLTFYLRHPLGSWLRSATFLALFAGLYSSLYVLLRLEDHALLMGSLMVFAMLSAVMIATRKLDWSAFSAAVLSPARPSNA
jgi:inner membrane protein